MKENIKKKYRADFRHFEKNSTIQSTLLLFTYIAQIFFLILLGFLSLRFYNEYSHVLIPIFIVLIATRFRGLNNIVHECSHLTFSDDKKYNFTLGSIASAFIFGSFSGYRAEHLTHHQHLGDFGRDLDFMHRKVFRFDEELTKPVVLRHILTPVFLLHMWHYFSIDMSARDGLPYLILKFLLATTLAFFFYFDPIAAVLLVIIPFAWVFSAINYWTDCVDHGGLITHKNDIEQSRNVVLPKWLRIVLFPRNDSFHLVHHLFPYVPSQHFEKCHEVLMEEATYRSQPKAELPFAKPIAARTMS